MQNVEARSKNSAFVIKDGRLVEVLRPLPNEAECGGFIDAISATFNKFLLVGQTQFDKIDSNLDVIASMAEVVGDIFGFEQYGVGRSTRFYEIAGEFGFGGQVMLRVHVGGQRDTVNLEVLGTGLLYARRGWAQQLHDFLVRVHGKLTRVDVAYDFRDGAGLLERVIEAYNEGFFNRGGQFPALNLLGSDWFSKDQSVRRGRTVAIGTRKSSARYIRVYEKGLQMGCEELASYVRFEVEFKSKGVEIPLDILVRPTAYLREVARDFIPEDNGETAKTRRVRKEKVEVKKAIEWVKNQCGKYLRFFNDFFTEFDIPVLDRLMAKEGEYPHRLAIEASYLS